MSDSVSGEIFENYVRRKIPKFRDFRIRHLTRLSGVLESFGIQAGKSGFKSLYHAAPTLTSIKGLMIFDFP